MFKKLLRLIPSRFRVKTPVIHVVRLEGVIASGRSMQSSLSGKSLEPLFKKAFKKGVSGVALAINCPGGSPVQSALIASNIRRLAEKHKIPVYAFCEDVAASGGYWLSCAADEIYADQNSIIGSIGVISGGFGFPEALAKLGVERRIYTAGTSKSTNDPFKPENPEEVAKLKDMLEEIHQSFIAEVKSRRGTKLNDDADLFTGAFWTGRKALELGLIDGIGHIETELRRKFGDKVEITEISAPKGWGLRRFGLSLATELPEAAFNSLEQRALWQRFGL
ncbi:MAG: S49 family peptidase [Aestuariivirga sp.]